LVDTLVNPNDDPDPDNWDVTIGASTMTVVQNFGPDYPDGGDALFEASWTPPPGTLVPGDPLAIPVTVSSRNIGNLETQYFFGLDVILLVNGDWDRQAVGAGASCAQTTVISGVYECSDPVTNIGELAVNVPSSGESYSVGVGALNCGGACHVTWVYERAPTEVTAAGDEESGAAADVTDLSDGEGSITSDATAEAVAALVDSGGAETAVLATAAVAVAVGASVVSSRQRTRRRSDRSNEDEDDEDEPREVVLELTYPAGRSPYVFQRGWLFGARAIVAPGTPDQCDISDSVRWSGDAVFNPPVGRQSRPSFIHGPGPDMRRQRAQKQITLQVEVDGVTTATTTTVGVTGTFDYSKLGDHASCPADAHGCPACPHSTVGPIDTGSPTVLLNGLPAARVGDHGIQAACCGPNTYTIVSGDESVLIDGRPAAHKDSVTRHCGGAGSIIMGSLN
jgi:uncharacterized Zn-binding protein involved in type VI secretion